MLDLSESTRIVVMKEQVSSELQGEAVVLNLKNGVYYGLDPIAARVWNLIQEPRTFADLRNTLAVEYDVDEKRLESDLRVLLSQLAEQQLVEISE